MSSKHKVAKRHRDAVETTSRPESPALEGRTPMPEELTGRADATAEDLRTLFASDTAEHFADGFRGGSNEDRETDIPEDPDTDPDADEDVTAV